MWAPGDPGHWPVWPLGAEPRAPGVTGAECMGRERVGEKPRAGLALPPASRPSSGQKLSVHAAVSTRPTGSCFRYDAHQQWPRKTQGWQGSARLPLSQCSLAPLLRLTCSSCPRSGSPPGLVLRHSPWLPPAGQPSRWLPPAGQPSPGRVVLSPSVLPSLPSAQTPPTWPLPPLSLPSSLP